MSTDAKKDPRILPMSETKKEVVWLKKEMIKGRD